MSLAQNLLMVRPSSFGSNPETLENNAFQSQPEKNSEEISKSALAEFDQMLNTLRENHFNILVLEEPNANALPDSVFPNNWFSTHDNSLMLIYPMFSKLRRGERREDFIKEIQKQGSYNLTLDLSQKELNGEYLEGTGSIVFDHSSAIAYCCESARSNKALFEELTDYLGYEACYFKACDAGGSPIYHTNVLMSIGTRNIVICLDSVSENDRERVLDCIKSSEKEVLEISPEQMNHFAGNLLLAKNTKNQAYWLMSETAYKCLSQDQINALNVDGEILYFSIPTIEKYGGGSVRCMLAELY